MYTSWDEAKDKLPELYEQGRLTVEQAAIVRYRLASVPDSTRLDYFDNNNDDMLVQTLLMVVKEGTLSFLVLRLLSRLTCLHL